MKALIVDDDQVSRAKMEVLMKNFGLCETAKSGIEALEIFSNTLSSKSPFQLVMLDISMPDMEGVEVLSKIRQIENDKKVKEENRTKIIMVTSKSDKETVVSCIHSGCNDYIIKPVSWKVIFNKLLKLDIIKMPQ